MSFGIHFLYIVGRATDSNEKPAKSVVRYQSDTRGRIVSCVAVTVTAGFFIREKRAPLENSISLVQMSSISKWGLVI